MKRTNQFGGRAGSAACAPFPQPPRGGIHPRLAGALFALAAWASVGWSAAHAFDGTRYVSIAGTDANNCTLAAPCRSLRRGIIRTPENGELRILDSGFYGNNATINKSMTIAGNGNTVYLGTSLTLAGPEAAVALRGLVLNGLGAVQDGIVITSAVRAHIEDCVVHGFARNGIVVAQGTGTQATVIGSTARNNGVAGLQASGGITRISDSTFIDNNQGIRITTGGVVETRGNNTVRGNTFNVVGSLTPFAGL